MSMNTARKSLVRAAEDGERRWFFGGGLHMTGQGWQTHIGPGRHPVSSAYFWYFKNPCGGAAEYDFDTDMITDAWQPREFEPTPDTFAEWAYPDGARRFTGIQTARA